MRKPSSKRRTAARPAAATATPTTPISATLSPAASELVRWYGALTRHSEAATIEGAVFGVLTRARLAYDDRAGDDSFDWLLDDVLATLHSEERWPARTPHTASVSTADSVSVTFTGAAAHAIGLAAGLRDEEAGFLVRRAVCQDLCALLFESSPEEYPAMATAFELPDVQEKGGN